MRQGQYRRIPGWCRRHPPLAAHWRDSDFDSSEPAFYSVRVIEIPTPRWTTYDAAFFGIDRPIGMGEVMRGDQSQRDNISLVILQLDPQTGEGTGEMIVGAGFGVDN